MIWWAIAVHLGFGVCLIARPVLATVSIFVGLDRITNTLGLPSVWLGVILICAALVAALGLLLEDYIPPRVSLLMLGPQYVILIGALFSDVDTIRLGEVSGRSVDRVVLFALLWPIIIAAVLHSCAIYERYTHRWTPNDL